MKGRKPGIATGSHALTKVPPAPTELSADARAEWKRAARILVARRHLTLADLGALESLCIAIGMRDEARRTLAKEGTTYPTAGGLIKAHPAVSIMRDALSAALRHQAELGLTPASRSRVTVGEGDSDDVSFLD